MVSFSEFHLFFRLILFSKHDFEIVASGSRASMLAAAYVNICICKHMQSCAKMQKLVSCLKSKSKLKEKITCSLDAYASIVVFILLKYESLKSKV